jgi:hypothetical protein
MILIYNTMHYICSIICMPSTTSRSNYAQLMESSPHHESGWHGQLEEPEEAVEGLAGEPRPRPPAGRRDPDVERQDGEGGALVPHAEPVHQHPAHHRVVQRELSITGTTFCACRNRTWHCSGPYASSARTIHRM